MVLLCSAAPAGPARQEPVSPLRKDNKIGLHNHWICGMVRQCGSAVVTSVRHNAKRDVCVVKRREEFSGPLPHATSAML